MLQLIKSYLRILRYILSEIPYIVKADKINARYLDIPAKKNRVNVFQYHPERFGYNLVNNSPYNLGDSLGEVIIRFLLAQKGIDFDKPVSKTRHLNCVGSNIFGSYQDSTIWGSGACPYYPYKSMQFCQKLSRRKLDVRAVRGPLTRDVLMKLGFSCPEVYGDPAILMPRIYFPPFSKTCQMRKRIVIPQFVCEQKLRDEYPDEHIVSMNTDDYKSVIDEILSSEIVYSSSLHGIILAESYGIPAVFFRGLKKSADFKYLDYYYSTGRKDIVVAESFEEALKMEPLPLPDFSKMRQGLLDSFPYDLWE